MILYTTSNSTAERLSKPLLIRFSIFEIPDYIYEEFEAISIRTWKHIALNIAVQIAADVLKTRSKDVRDVIKISKLVNVNDTQEDINRLIEIH
jgi:hypothetical protein